MSQPGEQISLRTDLKAVVWKRKDDGRSYQPSPEDPRSANEEKKYVRSQRKKKKKKHQSHSCRLGTYFVLKSCPPPLA